MRENLYMALDPFSDLLRYMQAQTVLSGGLVAGGAWAIGIPPPQRLKFWGLVRGSCWLALEGEQEPIRLQAGEVFLLAAPRSLVIGSDLAAPHVGLDDLLRERVGAVSFLGDGDEFYMIGGSVELGADCGQLLLEGLPSFIHVGAEAEQSSTLHWLLQQLLRERERGLPGADIASAQLAQLMFIEVLRAHFGSGMPLAAGWLRAVSDRRLAPALQLIHSHPGRAWQLEELAQASAMSRAAFAAYFKNVAGIAPVAYLTMWRMRLAEKALREQGASIGELARTLGYSSESAFSNAFKRVIGRAPKFVRSTTTMPL